MKPVLIACGCLLLTACAAPSNLVWQRIDGQRMADNPALETEYKRAVIICQGRTDAAQIYNVPAQGRAYEGCMAERGYWLKPLAAGMKIRTD